MVRARPQTPTSLQKRAHARRCAAELSRTWERAGKGKKLWQPGDDIGDKPLEARLLYSNWVLNPMALHVRDGCNKCLSARLVFAWLELPFKLLPTVGDDAAPRLDGSGVPSPDGSGCGLQSFGEIVSFGAAVAKTKSVAPATSRADVAAWLEAPSADALEPLLLGVTADGAPCLNAWGLSIDDAIVLPVLTDLLESGGDAPPKVCAYAEANLRMAGV
jgi:hypothetical protein